MSATGAPGAEAPGRNSSPPGRPPRGYKIYNAKFLRRNSLPTFFGGGKVSENFTGTAPGGFSISAIVNEMFGCAAAVS